MTTMLNTRIATATTTALISTCLLSAGLVLAGSGAIGSSVEAGKKFPPKSTSHSVLTKSPVSEWKNGPKYCVDCIG